MIIITLVEDKFHVKYLNIFFLKFDVILEFYLTLKSQNYYQIA
jgi:hypothetical protein